MVLNFPVSNQHYCHLLGLIVTYCLVLFESNFLMLSCAFAMQRRLDSMLFVGLTEKLQESATIFFSLVGDQVQVQSEALKGILNHNASVPGLINIMTLFLPLSWLYFVRVGLLVRDSCVVD